MRGRRLTAGVWAGLLAIALHAFAPLLAPALQGAASAPSAHAHGHAAHAHEHGAPDTAARQTPPAPDLVCVGDCPCCSLGDRVLTVPACSPAGVLPAAAVARWPHAVLAAPRSFRPGAHFPPRAPPVSA